MDDPLTIAGAVLVPLGFGLVPAFLPRSIPLFVRWALWAAVLAAAAAYVAVLAGTPPPFQIVALISAALAALLSMLVLLAETRRGAGGQGTPAQSR
jgi:hypothetical protein